MGNEGWWRSPVAPTLRNASKYSTRSLAHDRARRTRVVPSEPPAGVNAATGIFIHLMSYQPKPF